MKNNYNNNNNCTHKNKHSKNDKPNFCGKSDIINDKKIIFLFLKDNKQWFNFTAIGRKLGYSRYIVKKNILKLYYEGKLEKMKINKKKNLWRYSNNNNKKYSENFGNTNIPIRENNFIFAEVNFYDNEKNFTC